MAKKVVKQVIRLSRRFRSSIPVTLARPIPCVPTIFRIPLEPGEVGELSLENVGKFRNLILTIKCREGMEDLISPDASHLH